MIISERLAEYIKALECDLPEYLDELEQRALADEVPIIRKEAQSLLRFLLCLLRPEKILEVGCAVGFSAAFMIGAQTIINIGMCLMLLPSIGITLPFMSAGGSSNLCIYFGIGIVMSVYRFNTSRTPENV